MKKYLNSEQYSFKDTVQKRKYIIILTIFVIKTLFCVCRSDKCFFVVKKLTIE